MPILTTGLCVPVVRHLSMSMFRLPTSLTTQQAMISEVVPRGKEFLFFALFSIIGVRQPSIPH